MLAVPFINSYGFETDNWDATPGLSPGVTVTSGAANTKGSWAQIFSALAREVHFIQLQANSNQTSTAQRDVLMDIGVDPAGGTSYAVVKADLSIGNAATSVTLGPAYSSPLVIPAGATVAVRTQCNAATVTSKVIAKVWGDPSFPEMLPRGTYQETIGTITGSAGVGFTPGNGAWGSWQPLGTLTQPLWWWNMGVGVSSAAFGSEIAYVQLGFGDGTNMRGISTGEFQLSTTEAITHVIRSNLTVPDCQNLIQPGQGIYVRGWASAAPTSGWWALAYGTGGGL